MRNFPSLCLGLYLSIAFLAVTSCSSDESEQVIVFELTKPEETGITFVNSVPENDTLNQFIYHYLFNGNGVATGDLNNDGLPEIVFSGNEKSAALYLNKGDFKFEDITEKSGLKTAYWMSGISLADVNNDGFLDIYICRSGPNKNRDRKRNLLFINNGNLTFTEKGAEWGVDDPGNATCATFFDMDNDGDMDMYLGNHADRFFDDIATKFTPALHRDETSQQHLFRNDGKKFTDVSESAGVNAMGYCLSATAADFNKDGLVDLYICNDYHVPDYYYTNNGDGTFSNRFDTYFRHSSTNSMGADAADYNKDGWMDLFTVDMLSDDPRRFGLLKGPEKYEYYNTAQKNGYGLQYMRNNLQTNFNGHFSDLAYLNGVARTDWSWSPLFADFDNDGATDLFITNGYYRDVTNMDFMLFQNRKYQQMKQYASHKEILEKLPFEKISNYAFRNLGNYQFSNVTQQWGLEEPSLSTGSAYADLNADGKLDIIICNQGDVASVYKNVGTDKNYLRVKCKGGNKNNRFGIGCKLMVTGDSGTQIMEMQPSRGYQSASEPIFHIGLGNAQTLKQLTVIWPNGEFQVLKDVAGNQLLELDEKNAEGHWNYKQDNPLVFEDITAQTQLDFVHQEGDNPDFKFEPLIPGRYTMQGPGSATGDVNGDGLTDLLISNAMGSRGPVLYLQTPGGTLSAAPSQPWRTMNDIDVLGCLLFDADSDGDNDAYLAAGGNEYPFESARYKHRLYLNDGKGNFSEAPKALPDVNTSGSCIVAGDIDGDGDLDLFVGGRLKPRSYPEVKIRSYLLLNNKGSFSDVTEYAAPDLYQAGMVSAAVFCDYNNDNKMDLVVSGEWMPVAFLANNGSKLVNQSGATGTVGFSGWFNSLMAVDIDNDRDLDIVAGNKGMNSFLKATTDEPLKVYWTDLDGSGNIDFWLSYTRNNKEYPVFGLEEMLTAYPLFMNKRFTDYNEFAGKSVFEVFGEENCKKQSMKATEFNSLLLRNSDAVFSLEYLPRLVQSGPIFGIAAADLDENGFLDIVGMGNSYSPRVQHGRDDALHGFLLMNDGKALQFSQGINNGFYVPGDAKSLVWIDLKGKSLSLVANQNNDKSKVFSLKSKNLTFKASPPRASKAVVSLKNGGDRIENLTPGSGYLSASRPGVWINSQVKSVQFFDVNGNKL